MILFHLAVHDTQLYIAYVSIYTMYIHCGIDDSPFLLCIMPYSGGVVLCMYVVAW